MKKLSYLIIIVLISSLALTGCSVLSDISQVPATEQTKAKPVGNPGAQTYAWHLSAAVMPVPPYGSGDIPGSDTASKLIVNQPNGNTEVTLTGVMNGLAPNTTYEVRLQNPYTPYVFTGWDVTGSYVIYATLGNIVYTEYLTLAQSGTGITGTSLALAGNASPWTIESGLVNGNTVTFLAYFNNSPTLHAEFTGLITTDGSISGNWADVSPGTRSGTWGTTSGAAVKTHTGNDWSSGVFNNQPIFTFMTDAYGSGSWHLNLTNEDFPNLGIYALSVWINAPGRTVLISDNFSVVVD